jgi:ubiquinone biosynthesis protein UbiJ
VEQYLGPIKTEAEAGAVRARILKHARTKRDRSAAGSLAFNWRMVAARPALAQKLVDLADKLEREAEGGQA